MVDDLIEPWRPWVDMAIIEWFADDYEGSVYRDITIVDKQKLVSLLHHQAILNNEKMTLLTAISRMIASFQTAILKQQPQRLLIPELCPLLWHQYE